MRIAVSGTHRVGKTTLAEALAEHLPGHELVPEPYYQLEDDGHEFEAMPSIDDFERQLERSLQSLEDGGADAIYDRCPLDIVGYLVTHRDADAFEIDRWMPRIETAMARLDLVVFVPIERPDRMPVSPDDAGLRAEVDEELSGLVPDDAHDLAFDVIAVTGSVQSRVGQVLAHLRR